jgi:hypothetical protein
MAAWAPFNTIHWGMLSQPDKQKSACRTNDLLVQLLPTDQALTESDLYDGVGIDNGNGDLASELRGGFRLPRLCSFYSERGSVAGGVPIHFTTFPITDKSLLGRNTITGSSAEACCGISK